MSTSRSKNGSSKWSKASNCQLKLPAKSSSISTASCFSPDLSPNKIKTLISYWTMSSKSQVATVWPAANNSTSPQHGTSMMKSVRWFLTLTIRMSNSFLSCMLPTSSLILKSKRFQFFGQSMTFLHRRLFSEITSMESRNNVKDPLVWPSGTNYLRLTITMLLSSTMKKCSNSKRIQFQSCKAFTNKMRSASANTLQKSPKTTHFSLLNIGSSQIISLFSSISKIKSLSLLMKSNRPP